MAKTRTWFIVLLVLSFLLLGAFWLDSRDRGNEQFSACAAPVSCGNSALEHDAPLEHSAPLAHEPTKSREPAGEHAEEVPEESKEAQSQPAETEQPEPAPKETKLSETSVSGRVVDSEGAGVPGLQVALCVVAVNGSSASTSWRRLMTDEYGSFIATGDLFDVAHGYLIVRTPEGALYTHPERLDLTPAALENILVALPALTTLNGRVVDGDGNGVKSTIQASRPKSGERRYKLDHAHVPVPTDEQGNYKLQVFETGPIILLVEPLVYNFASATIETTTLPTMATWVPDIVLNRELNAPMQVRFRPVNEQGESIVTAGGVYAMISMHFRNGAFSGEGSTLTSDDGWITVTIDDPETTHLTVMLEGFKTSEPIRFAFQHEETLDYGLLNCVPE